MADSGVAIGIELGTCKCCVGVVRDGKVEILENERGSKTTPSYVAFTDTERLVGDDAKDQATLNPANTVFGVKGIIGRNFDEAKAHCQVNRLPFELVELAGKPRIRVNYKGEERLFSAEQISSMLLARMKKMAESHLGCSVTNAVISVPAYFNNSQRQATKAAAEIAGLKVLRLINEPTAAAISFALNRRSVKEETVVILDIGAGTVDTSVMNIKEGSIEVRSSQGDCHLGGQVIDVCLLNHFIDEFRQKYDQDLSGNKKAVERLRCASEKVKHTLSLLPKSCLQLDCLFNEVDFESTISRDDFDALYDELVSKSLDPVFVSAGVTVEREIDHVVVVGGTSRVPKVHTIVSDFFGKGASKTINVNEAVANGAAVQAALLMGDSSFGKIKVSDVTPHLIDLVPPTGSVVTIVTSNRTIPFQEGVLSPLEGDTTFSEFVHHSNALKQEYNLLRSPGDVRQKSSAGGQMIEVKYGIDGDGIFFASVLDQTKEPSSAPTHVDACFQLVDKVQLAEMAHEASVIDEDDKEHQATLLALSELESYCFSLKKKVSEVINGSPVGSDVIVQSCDEILEWMDTNTNAPRDALLNKRKEMEDLFSSVREQTAG